MRGVVHGGMGGTVEALCWALWGRTPSAAKGGPAKRGFCIDSVRPDHHCLSLTGQGGLGVRGNRPVLPSSSACTHRGQLWSSAEAVRLVTLFVGDDKPHDPKAASGVVHDWKVGQECRKDARNFRRCLAGWVLHGGWRQVAMVSFCRPSPAKQGELLYGIEAFEQYGVAITRHL